MTKIYIITPVSRIKNIYKIIKSVDFSKIYKWIIIYDTRILKNQRKLFKNNSNIIELFHKDKYSVTGNSQRNYALDFLSLKKNKNFYVYFLDDDNIIHKNFYNVIEEINENNLINILTFDQLRLSKVFINKKYTYVKIFKGNLIKVGSIDSAMFIVNFSLVHNIRWIKNKYDADGRYINECISKNKKYHKYIPLTASYYNYFNINFFQSLRKNFKLQIFNFFNSLFINTKK